jgi:DNA repair protein RadA/Sms
MARLRSAYICQQCGYEQARWFGKCPQCGEWNTAVESAVEKGSKKAGERDVRKSVSVEPVALNKVPKNTTKRVKTEISELDRVLGGGLVAGQVTLIAGEPGIGKSTLLLQVANKLSVGSGRLTNKKKKRKQSTENSKQSTVLYVSGEESVSQIKIRADRLDISGSGTQLLEETDIDNVIHTLKGRTFQAVIVDSIQTMSTTNLTGMAGSVGQVRECSYRLVRLAKSRNIPIFIVGHVTKKGSIAGPSVLMHIVDTVLWFEGEKSLTLRLLRAVKNRFGPTDEVGVFEMKDKGLVSVGAPEKIFLSDAKKNMPGTCVTSVMEGTRPLLVEIQSLVVPSKLAYPKRIAQGMDQKRFELMLAILQRRCGLPLFEFDCYVNVAGGISIKGDPSSDLAVCLSVASAFFDKPLPSKTLTIGEVGLLGDVREVVAQAKRVKEAKRLGYKNIVTNKQIDYLRNGVKKYFR